MHASVTQSSLRLPLALALAALAPFQLLLRPATWLARQLQSDTSLVLDFLALI